MDPTTDPALQNIPVSLRNLHSSNGYDNPLSSPLGPEYHDHDAAGFSSYALNEVQPTNNGQVQPFSPQQQQQQQQNLQTPSRYPNPSFHRITTPNAAQQQLQSHQLQSHLPITPNQDDSTAKESGSHFRGMKAVPNPANLEQWREKLFNVNEMITLTEDDFQTYFPHVDNIYSHRSTQRYKRKPFVSHYWDCRLKGRPPGTPKTEDPAKKKRRRTARQRDLCDVKIKITEFFPGADVEMAHVQAGFGGAAAAGLDQVASGSGGGEFVEQRNEAVQPFGVLAPSLNLPPDHPGAGGARYYTIQRVNGLGAGKENEGEGSGGHKHSLAESDAIKKNSVRRKLMKEEKVDKKRKIGETVQTPSIAISAEPQPQTPQSQPQPPTPTHRPGTTALLKSKTLCTGLAAQTARQHSKTADLTLFGGALCPHTQCIWIALEVKGLPYQYVETFDGDDQILPEALVEGNPRKRLPCLKHGSFVVWDSGVVLEYLDEIDRGHGLLPPLGEATLRAHSRMWAGHIHQQVIPAFDAVLASSSTSGRENLVAKFEKSIADLAEASHATGPFFLGPGISLVDILFAPWIIRLSRNLNHYRGWAHPRVMTRWEKWLRAIEEDQRVRRTVCDEKTYRDAFERSA